MKLIKLATTKTKLDECPKCLTLLNAVTEVRPGGQPPKPGDLSVCCYCAQLLKFNGQLNRLAMTDDDYEALKAEEREELDAAQAFVKAQINRQGGF